MTGRVLILTLGLACLGLAVSVSVASAQQAASQDERCRIDDAGRLTCDPVDRAKLDPEQEDREFFSSHALDGELRPTRLFAGPNLYPPEDYRGYGILAFRSRATSYDRDRHEMICAAYIASLPASDEVEAPTEDQFVTIWPVETDTLAVEIGDLPERDVCPAAIDAYSQDAALRAIAAAKQSGFDAEGLGPYLLAWSPPADIGKEGAFVLALDLSNVRGFDQSLALMTEWNRDIETDFEILANGFTLERLRVSIRRWADSYGEGFLKLVQPG